jgi:hypothetical protein
LVLAAVSFISVGIPILGLMVGRTIESIMILHDFYIVFPIVIGVGFIGVLAFSNERYPDAIKSIENIRNCCRCICVYHIVDWNYGIYRI